MNISCFSTDAYVLLTPSLNIVNGDATCTVSFSFPDDSIGDEEKWIHSMLRCHKATATYAAKNLKKGDHIFISGARYHVDESEGIKGEIKRTHYFSRGSIKLLVSANDLSELKGLSEKGKQHIKHQPENETSDEQWEQWLNNEEKKPIEDTECPF